MQSHKIAGLQEFYEILLRDSMESYSVLQMILEYYKEDDTKA